MSKIIEPLTSQLKKARQSQGLTQQQLAQKLAIPQSHLSRIESGAIDIRLSSLIEYARSLHLEVMLIPVPHLTLVNAIIRGKSGSDLPAYMPDEDETSDEKSE